MSETLKTSQNMLGESYEAKLREHFDEQVVDSLAQDWRYAELPDQPGETLPYVRLNEGASKPVLYIPGFTEGIVAKAPLAAEMAGRGYDFILPDQNRKAILKDAATDKKSATYSQAINYLSVIEAEGLDSVNIVTHSYGSQIFDAMVEIAEARGMDCFKESEVVMLAPAGFSKETALSLGSRLLKSMASEGKKNPKEFDDPAMLKAGLKNFAANIPRTARESSDLRKKLIDPADLTEKVGNVHVLSYAADELYPEEAISDQVQHASEGYGVTWAVPIAQKERFDPETSKPHATHNDEQFNPYRVAGAVDQILAHTKNS